MDEKRTHWRRRPNSKCSKASPELSNYTHQVKERQISRLCRYRPQFPIPQYKSRCIRITKNKFILQTTVHLPNATIKTTLSTIQFQPERLNCTFVPTLPQYSSNGTLKRKGTLITTYHHGEHRVRGLKTVGTFFPKVAIFLNSDDVTANSISRFRDDDVGGNIGVFSGKCLGDAEATDATTNDHAVDGRGISGAGIGLSGGFGRRCGGLLGNGTAEAEDRIKVIARGF